MESIGLYLGPVLVTFGWVFTNEINIRNSRKQQTITLILQYSRTPSASTTRKRSTGNCRATRPSTRLSSSTTCHRNCFGPSPRELNYFEFLASAIRRREIDGNLMHRVFQDIVIRHGKTLGPFIMYCRKDSASTWADFVELYEQWKKPGDPKLS